DDIDALIGKQRRIAAERKIAERLQIARAYFARAVMATLQIGDADRSDIEAGDLRLAMACQRHRQGQADIAKTDDGDPVAFSQGKWVGHEAAGLLCEVPHFPQPSGNVNVGAVLPPIPHEWGIGSR